MDMCIHSHCTLICLKSIQSPTWPLTKSMLVVELRKSQVCFISKFITMCINADRHRPVSVQKLTEFKGFCLFCCNCVLLCVCVCILKHVFSPLLVKFLEAQIYTQLYVASLKPSILHKTRA